MYFQGPASPAAVVGGGKGEDGAWCDGDGENGDGDGGFNGLS